MDYRSLVSLLWVVGLICSCAGPGGISGDVSPDGGEPDTNSPTDVRDAGSDSQREDGHTADADTDASEALVFDPKLWKQQNACEGEITFPAEDEGFQRPSREPMEQPSTRTREEIIVDFDGLPEHAGWSVRPDESLTPGPGYYYDLYAQSGQDVPIHMYVLTPHLERDSHRLNVTVMVDYEPVDVRYVRWNPGRTDKWLNKSATGVGFAMKSDVEIIDITLPKELFTEERMYEVAVTFNVTTTERRPFGDAVRFALYHGGYNRPSRPCAETRLSESAVAVERRALTRAMSDDLVALFFEGITEEDFRQTIEVEPGETRRFYASVFRDDFNHGPNPTVLVPVLNGAPIGPTWWITQGESDDSSDWDTIDARKSFEVTFPEEPGLYEVQVATWEDPYKIWRSRDGVRNEDVSQGGGISEGSNALRFRVVDLQSE